jgi:hydrogenase expression/formation protein HypC
MCLAIPAQVIFIDGDDAQVCIGGVKKKISLALVENIAVGDYVLVHVGYALNKISVEEARKTLQLFVEAGMVESDP